jgi:hypothetical protein
MQRLALIFTLFTLILFSSHPTTIQAQDQTRLVVFEAFTTENVGANAGEAIDRLAKEYADRSVVFLEHDYDNRVGDRYSRWLAADDGIGGAALPLVMVDSGYEIREGKVSYYNTYKSIVNAARQRPADAEIEAISYRIGDSLHFDIDLTNLCGTALDSGNSATIHALVYEEARVLHTGRFVRAATSIGISTPLFHGVTREYALQITLSDVDWDKIHPLVLVDYRPGGSGAFDMLQAAQAPITTFTVRPEELVFMVDPTDTMGRTITMDLDGPDKLTWSSMENVSWLTITPFNGPMTTPPVVSIMGTALSFGWQEAVITFTTSITRIPVPVSVYYGAVDRVHLPLVMD